MLDVLFWRARIVGNCFHELFFLINKCMHETKENHFKEKKNLPDEDNDYDDYNDKSQKIAASKCNPHHDANFLLSCN